MKRITLTLLIVALIAFHGLSVATASEKPSSKPVKIYLVAGQSNAELRGNIEWAQKSWPGVSFLVSVLRPLNTLRGDPETRSPWIAERIPLASILPHSGFIFLFMAQLRS